MASLRLRVKGPTGEQHVITAAADESVADFSVRMQELFKIRENMDILTGFPPRPVTREVGGTLGAVVRSGDSVVLRCLPPPAPAPGKSAGASADTTTTAKTPPTLTPPPPPLDLQVFGARRSGRTAHVAGTYVDVEAIEAAKARKKKTAKAKTKRARPAAPTAVQRKKSRGVHTLGSGSTSTQPKRSSSPFVKALGVGNTLSGSPVRQKRRLAMGGSQQEVGESLVDAMRTGSNDPLSKFFRYATQSAVRKQYDVTRANNRFKSVLSGDYAIRKNEDTRRLGDGTTSGDDHSHVALKVRFKVGMRTWEEEDVELITADALQALVRGIVAGQGESGKELLKPHRMSEVSARTFWSIVFHYGPDISAALRTMCPEIDFSFLTARAKRLTEKALKHIAMNEARLERLKQRKAKEAVRALKKAEAALQAKTGETESSGSSSKETACTTVEEHAPDPEVTPFSWTSFLDAEVIAALAAASDIVEMGQLADVDDAEELFEDLSDELGAEKCTAHTVTLAAVKEWIETAREESLLPLMEHIIRSLSDGASESKKGATKSWRQGGSLQPLLTVLAGNGIVAPRDLTVYKPHTLFDKLNLGDGGPTVEEIDAWRNKAWEILGQRPWLSEYFHAANASQAE
jgi:hypothetical protein